MARKEKLYGILLYYILLLYKLRDFWRGSMKVVDIQGEVSKKEGWLNEQREIYQYEWMNEGDSGVSAEGMLGSWNSG